MTPDKIWACQSGETQYWCNGEQLYKAKEFVGEYTRTSAHPVTVDMLKNWFEVFNNSSSDGSLAETGCLLEIRAAIAQMGDGK